MHKNDYYDTEIISWNHITVSKNNYYNIEIITLNYSTVCKRMIVLI